MAHFSELDENNTVLRTLVVSNDDITDEDGVEREQIGVGFLKSLFGYDTTWKQTSYNGSFRGNYANEGYSYLENVSTLGVASTDIFIQPKPHDSWTIDQIEPVWVSPIGESPGLTTTQIEDRYYYRWDESSYQQDNSTGWILDQWTPSVGIAST